MAILEGKKGGINLQNSSRIDAKYNIYQWSQTFVYKSKYSNYSHTSNSALEKSEI